MPAMLDDRSHERWAAREAVVLVAKDEFGSAAAAALRTALHAAPEAAALVVDVTGVEFVDGRGVNALLGAAHRLREEGRSLVVRGASTSVRSALRAVGLHRWAAVE